MSLLYNPETKQLLDKVTIDMPHALLLEGPVGVGLSTIARDLAWHDLAGLIQSTDNENNVDISSKGVIRISQIRDLIESTRSKLTKRRVYVIDEADKMSIQAQNAFLKLLEEPNKLVSFILTSHTPQKLLPTIISRVQRIHIKPIDQASSRNLIKNKGVNDERKQAQLLFLAGGLPAELSRLINDEKLFTERSTYAADARTFIQGTPYQKAMIAQKYHGDRASALEMLTVAQQILRHSLSSNPSPSIVRLSDQLADAYDRILANGNIRLQLINLVLQ